MAGAALCGCYNSELCEGMRGAQPCLTQGLDEQRHRHSGPSLAVEAQVAPALGCRVVVLHEALVDEREDPQGHFTKQHQRLAVHVLQQGHTLITPLLQ